MFRPKEIRNNIYEITPEEIFARGLKAVICDLDDTLLPHHGSDIPCKLTSWIQNMRDAGIEVMIISNGKKRRITPVCESIGIPFTPMACKPFPFGFIKAKRILGLKGKEILYIGDQIFTDMLGANLAGLETLLVTPISFKTTWIWRLKRSLEKPFRKARRN